MAKKTKQSYKFEFTTDFQWDLIRFTVQDKNGYKVIGNFDDSNFEIVEHAIIARVLKNYYKENKKLPGQTLLKEGIRELLRSTEYKRVVTKEQEKEILGMVKPMYKDIVQDGDKIYELSNKFKSYCKLRNVIETTDLNNFDGYQYFAQEVGKAIVNENDTRDKQGMSLIRDVKERQFRRQDESPIIPTPIKQINALTNAGGYSRGSIIVLLDMPKRFKTGMLVNIARLYLRQRKNILYIDLENGEDEVTIRLEQSIMQSTKKQILSGKHDDGIQKKLRKYKRLGSEFVVKRFPAHITTTMDIQRLMDDYYRQWGIKFQVLIVDYPALMASTTGKEDDFNRISDTFVDIANLNTNPQNDLEHIYAANHVKREASKRTGTRYEGNDIAKCIDIVRHAQVIFGLNSTADEEEAGYLRLEVVEQRDGKKGKAVFGINKDNQRVDELSRKQRIEFDEIFSSLEEEEEEEKPRRKRNTDI